MSLLVSFAVVCLLPLPLFALQCTIGITACAQWHTKQRKDQDTDL